MKNLFPIILLFTLFFNSCKEQEPFDNTLLDYDYWQMFSRSMELVAFDNFATSSQGYQRESNVQHYIYTSDMINLETYDRLYFIHFRINNSIVYSMVDSIYFTSTEKHPMVEWMINDEGIIEACTKYDNDGKLIGSEEYDIELNQFIEETENGIMYLGRLLYIHEKRKFNNEDKLIETLKYTYGDNNTYEISRFDSEGKEIK